MARARAPMGTSSARPRSSVAFPASRRCRVPRPRCTRSRMPAVRNPFPSRNGSNVRRARLRVLANEQVGPYTLLRVERSGIEPGIPGQFFMLEAPGRLLPRPMLVGGGIGIAPLPYLSEALGAPPAVLGFRSDRHAEAAELVPNAQACVEPTLVTQLIPVGMDVLACGPEPMLEAVRVIAPEAQLAWEAPMACGYGACYGCAVEIDGELKRLCVEGPVLMSANAA